jgi:hypothetical protein
MKRFSYLVVFVILLFFLSAPIAFGQALDGKWLQLKMNFKGYAFEYGGLDKINKSSGSATNYMLLTWDAGGYTFKIFQPDGTELIQRFDTVAYFTPDLLEYQETLRHVGMRFGRDDSNYIDTFITALIKIKRDSQGALKSATFNSLGCEVYDGEMETFTAFGGCTIKGKTIDAPPFL